MKCVSFFFSSPRRFNATPMTFYTWKQDGYNGTRCSAIDQYISRDASQTHMENMDEAKSDTANRLYPP
jgi:hypothetical protein